MRIPQLRCFILVLLSKNFVLNDIIWVNMLRVKTVPKRLLNRATKFIPFLLEGEQARHPALLENINPFTA